MESQQSDIQQTNEYNYNSKIILSYLLIIVIYAINIFALIGGLYGFYLLTSNKKKCCQISNFENNVKTKVLFIKLRSLIKGQKFSIYVDYEKMSEDIYLDQEASSFILQVPYNTHLISFFIHPSNNNPVEYDIVVEKFTLDNVDILNNIRQRKYDSEAEYKKNKMGYFTKSGEYFIDV